MTIDYDKKRKKKRIAALIGSGILVVIILPILGSLFSIFIDRIFGFPILLMSPVNIIISIPVLVIGFFWAIWSNVALFTIGKGTPVPTKDTQTIKLVIKGPYKYTRNPMIFGYILIWVGLGLFLNSIFLTFGFSSIITVLLILFVKFWEEKNLEERFGRAYLEYIEKTSFVIPIPRKKKKLD